MTRSISLDHPLPRPPRKTLKSRAWCILGRRADPKHGAVWVWHGFSCGTARPQTWRGVAPTDDSHPWAPSAVSATVSITATECTVVDEQILVKRAAHTIQPGQCVQQPSSVLPRTRENQVAQSVPTMEAHSNEIQSFPSPVMCIVSKSWL